HLIYADHLSMHSFPTRPLPIFGRLSLPPVLRLWQELQEMKPDMDSRGSNHNCLPSSTFSGSVTVAGSMGLINSAATRSACACALKPSPAAMAIASNFFMVMLLDTCHDRHGSAAMFRWVKCRPSEPRRC